MAIKSRSEKPPKKIEIDLNGPEGNAHEIMGLHRRLGRQLGYSEAKLDSITKVMMSGSYDCLVKVFDNFYGNHVTIWK